MFFSIDSLGLFLWSWVSLLVENFLWTIGPSFVLLTHRLNCRFVLLLLDGENVYIQNAFEVLQDKVDKMAKCAPDHNTNGEHHPKFIENRFAFQDE